MTEAKAALIETGTITDQLVCLALLDLGVSRGLVGAKDSTWANIWWKTTVLATGSLTCLVQAHEKLSPRRTSALAIDGTSRDLRQPVL